MELTRPPREPYYYSSEQVPPNKPGPDPAEETRCAFNRALDSFAKRYGVYAVAVNQALKERTLNPRQHPLALHFASAFFCTMAGVNLLRHENGRRPYIWQSSEDAICLGDRSDTFPVKIWLARERSFVFQREGIIMDYILPHVKTVAGSPRLDVVGNRDLANSDWQVLHRASRRYLDLHPQDNGNPVKVPDRINHEAFLISLDHLRAQEHDEQNFRNATYIIEDQRRELRL